MRTTSRSHSCDSLNYVLNLGFWITPQVARDRYLRCFEIRDWAAMTEMCADGVVLDDRHPVIGAGVFRGLDATGANMRAVAEFAVPLSTSNVIARQLDLVELREQLLLVAGEEPAVDVRHGLAGDHVVLVAGREHRRPELHQQGRR